MGFTKKCIAVCLSLIMLITTLSAIATPASAGSVFFTAAIGGFTQGDHNSWIKVENIGYGEIEIDSLTLTVAFPDEPVTYTYFEGVYILEPGTSKSFSYLLDYDYPMSYVGSHPCSIVLLGYDQGDSLFGSVYYYNTTFVVQDDSQTSSSSDIFINSLASSPLTIPVIIASIAMVAILLVLLITKRSKKTALVPPQQAKIAPLQQNATQSDARYCPKCGSPFSGEHQYCPFCGFKRP